MQKGTIYKHNGKWLFRYKVPVFENGVRAWKSKYESLAPANMYSTAAQVEKDFANRLRTLRGDLEISRFTPNTTQLLRDFIEKVYFPEQKTRLKPSTLFGYRHVYNRHVKPNLNDESMMDIKLPNAQKLLDKIAAATPLSSSSLKHIKWFLKAVFDLARTEEAYDAGLVNPFAEVRLPQARKHRQTTRYATLDQVLDMIDSLDEPAATVVSVAAFSGLRKSEIQGLRWEDLNGNELHVQRTAWRTTNVQETTKTDASRGSVPVLKILAKHLEAHRNGFPNEGFIFTGPKLGKPLDLHNLANRTIRPALKKAGIPWPGWHGFRRGLATNLHTLGVADMDIQRILRHSDVRTTQQSYIKVEDRVRQAAMARLEKTLNAKKRIRRRK